MDITFFGFTHDFLSKVLWSHFLTLFIKAFSQIYKSNKFWKFSIDDFEQNSCRWEWKTSKYERRSKNIIVASLCSCARAMGRSYKYQNFLIFIALPLRLEMER